MKALLVLAVATTAVAAAQEPPKPQLRSGEPAPAPATTLELSPVTPAANDTISLIPETLEPVPMPNGEALTAPLPMQETPQKLEKTTAAEDELNDRIRFRELKTKFERDPKVMAEAERARTAKTDFEKREALKAYYTALYDRIGKADPRLAQRAFRTRERFIHRMKQTQVAPTEPLDDRFRDE